MFGQFTIEKNRLHKHAARIHVCLYYIQLYTQIYVVFINKITSRIMSLQMTPPVCSTKLQPLS